MVPAGPKVIDFEEIARNNASHSQLFYCDVHLNNPPQLQHALPAVFSNQETRINFPPPGISNKRFKLCHYRVGNWQVMLVWPVAWKAPAANSLGWLPKLEFGDPNSGPYYTDVNPALTNPVAPFTYTAHDGSQYTPSAPG
jgi:hypothetical protein